MNYGYFSQTFSQVEVLDGKGSPTPVNVVEEDDEVDPTFGTKRPPKEKLRTKKFHWGM
jgi:hypothetical protein